MEAPGILLVQIQQILSEDLIFYRKIMDASAAPLMQEQLVNIVLEYLQLEFAGKLPISLNERTQKSQELLNSIIGIVQMKPKM